MNTNIYVYIILMSLTTYLIRMLPLAVFRKKINNKFIKSFLYYVPYACLACMTIPAILLETSSIYSGVVGLIVSLFLSYKEKSLITVASFACISVFIVEKVLELLRVI